MSLNFIFCFVLFCKLLSCVWLFETPWTVTRQALLPWDFPGKDTGVGCHFLLQGIFPPPGIEPWSPILQADSLLLIPQVSPAKALNIILFIYMIRVTRLDLRVHWEDNKQCMTQPLILCLTRSCYSIDICWMKHPLSRIWDVKKHKPWHVVGIQEMFAQWKG